MSLGIKEIKMLKNYNKKLIRNNPHKVTYCYIKYKYRAIERSE